MPRGNDTEGHAAFATQIESTYGQFQNAEDMVRAHQAGIDRGLARASLTQVDEEATAAALKDLSKTEKKFDLADGEELVSVAVRGNALIGVIQDEDGNHRKAVVGANERFKELKLTPDEEATRAQAESDRKVAVEAARLRAESDAKIEELRQEEAERVAAELAKIREAGQKDVEKAQASAAKEKGSG